MRDKKERVTCDGCGIRCTYQDINPVAEIDAEDIEHKDGTATSRIIRRGKNTDYLTYWTGEKYLHFCSKPCRYKSGLTPWIK